MIRTVLKERITNNSMIPFMVKNEDTKQAVKQTMQLEGFFPTPIGFVQMDKTLNKKILEINKIKQFKFRKNFGGGGNDVSSDLYILDKDELSDIKKVLTDSVNEYFKEIVNPDKDMKLYITNSWINVNKNGESHHAHKHTNSIVSSVLYIDTHEGDTITFLNPNDNLFGNLKIGNNTTMWDSNEWIIPTKNNLLIMFPSTLTHAVSARPNTCTGTRISLSFNTWFKGTIGCGEGSPDQLCL